MFFCFDDVTVKERCWYFDSQNANRIINKARVRLTMARDSTFANPKVESTSTGTGLAQLRV